MRYGQGALLFALLMLAVLLGTLFWRGSLAFLQVEMSMPVMFDAQALELASPPDFTAPGIGLYNKLAQNALRAQFPDVQDPEQKRELLALLSSGAGFAVRDALITNPEWLGMTQLLTLPASSLTERAHKYGLKNALESGAVTEAQAEWITSLRQRGMLTSGFNTSFFSEGDSRQPEKAGFLGAIIGSVLTMLVTLAVAFPLGVMTAVYLEEFARKGKLIDLIEVNINNLAAVPSIVFGLLGLALYLNFMHLPRSAPLVGGLTLALMILPVIIIATRMALRAVPDSIRHGALALGASPLQAALHHTLPLAVPGIMTGTILGVARALGETAPLLMIGMVAFIADVPTNPLSPATVMPVQVYLWASSPEAGFAEKTSAGILVLLSVLLALNALAIYIRKRFEIRW